MVNDLNTAEVSALCKSCGMCCDGTLFGHAEIIEEYDKELAKNLGLEIAIDENIEKIKLPCPCFNKYCTVYDQPKPTICSSFFCVILKKYKHNKLDFNELEVYINKTLALKDEILNDAKMFDNLKEMNWQCLTKFLKNIKQKNDIDELNLYGILILKHTMIIDRMTIK